jgi:SET domain-containing protein
VLPRADAYVAASPVHGRGVFAGRRFAEGEEIETAPVIVVPDDVKGHLDWTPLWGCYFEWRDGAAGIALGFGSLYNHSWAPNARYDQDFDDDVIRFSALRTIEPGEEITINYTGDPDGRDELWFVPTDPPPTRPGVAPKKAD